MTMQHKSLEDEILFLLGRSSTPLDVGQLYERVEMAEEIKQVSNALYRMKHAKKITPTAFEGRRAYKLADGVAAPAPAGKAGRPTDAAPAAAPLADPGIGLEGAAGKTQRAKAAKPKADPIPQAGKMVESSAERLADAILAESREQLETSKTRWSINQAGGVSVYGETGILLLSPLQARMLAKVVLAAHAVLEQRA